MHLPFTTSLLPLILSTVTVLPFCTYAAAAVASHQNQKYSTRLVYEFPVGVWLENLAVRRSGSVLTTQVSQPNLYQIDPLATNPEPVLVHHFPYGNSVLGITETEHDVFYVITVNISLATFDVTPNSNQISRVSFPDGKSAAGAKVDLIATLPDAMFLNGLTTLNSRTLLAADSFKGVVWAIDTHTGAARVAISDPLMAPTGPVAPAAIGVNGVKVHQDRDCSHKSLYFTVSARALVAKIAINEDGTPAGRAVHIANAPAGQYYDDLIVGRHGDVFVAGANGENVLEVSQTGKKQTVIAGSLNSTEVAEPTAVAFGRTRRDSNVLYVTTAGGLGAPVDGNKVVGGQLLAINLENSR